MEVWRDWYSVTEKILDIHTEHKPQRMQHIFHVLYIYCMRNNGLFPITVHAYWWLLPVKNSTHSIIILTQTELSLDHFSWPFSQLFTPLNSYVKLSKVQWDLIAACQLVKLRACCFCFAQFDILGNFLVGGKECVRDCAQQAAAHQTCQPLTHQQTSHTHTEALSTLRVDTRIRSQWDALIHKPAVGLLVLNSSFKCSSISSGKAWKWINKKRMKVTTL